MNLILLGIPGSGKGSVAELLISEWGLSHMAPGDILREELKQKSRLGLLAKPFMEKGELVPDDVILEVMEKRLSQLEGEKSFILDGFPRTLGQAKRLDQVLAGLRRTIDFVLKFEVSDSTAMKRLAGRQTCSVCGAIYNLYRRPPREKDVCDACGGPLFQRADDKEEVILRRLEVYRRRTQPIEQHYAHQGKLKPVDAEASPHAVFEEIVKTVGAG